MVASFSASFPRFCKLKYIFSSCHNSNDLQVGFRKYLAGGPALFSFCNNRPAKSPAHRGRLPHSAAFGLLSRRNTKNSRVKGPDTKIRHVTYHCDWTKLWKLWKQNKKANKFAYIIVIYFFPTLSLLQFLFLDLRSSFTVGVTQRYSKLDWRAATINGKIMINDIQKGWQPSSSI